MIHIIKKTWFTQVFLDNKTKIVWWRESKLFIQWPSINPFEIEELIADVCCHESIVI